jgi:hypothetical protein
MYYSGRPIGSLIIMMLFNSHGTQVNFFMVAKMSDCCLQG